MECGKIFEIASFNFFEIFNTRLNEDEIPDMESIVAIWISLFQAKYETQPVLLSQMCSLVYQQLTGGVPYWCRNCN